MDGHCHSSKLVEFHGSQNGAKQGNNRITRHVFDIIEFKTFRNMNPLLLNTQLRSIETNLPRKDQNKMEFD